MYYAPREVANRSVIESFSAMFGRLRNFRPQDTEQTPLLGDMAADVTTDGNDDNYSQNDDQDSSNARKTNKIMRKRSEANQK